MSSNTPDSATLRLKAVLDILAEQKLSEGNLGAGGVLAEAVERFPLDERERELLSGGVPRGHKNLTTATAKLVKAGWLVKGRSGWTITDDGLKATAAFADPASFAAALAQGTPVPADMPVPTVAPKRAGAAKAPGRAAAKSAKPAAETAPRSARTPRPKKAAAATAAVPQTASAPQPETPAAIDLGPQPDAVAIAGDFSMLLGAPEPWAPEFDEVQMVLDPMARLWELTAELPAGHYTYKIAINRSWEENYGAFGVRDGANHELHHSGGRLTFRYDHSTNDVTTG